MTVDRQAELERRIRESLSPESLQIKDQSHLHAGHAGAQDGRSHFAVRVVSASFEGLSKLERHRLLYQGVGDLMQTDIHALSVKALAPSEL